MASIKVNGVTHMSGAGFHARKGEPGRTRTRAAVRDAALKEEVGVAFRLGSSTETLTGGEGDALDTFERYAEWDR